MLQELRDAIVRHVDGLGGADGLHATAVKGLAFLRSTSRTLPHSLIYRPQLCLVVQGAKRLALGEATFDYSEGEALIISVELPGFGYVTRASRTVPFLSLVLDFDIGILREVLELLDPPPKQSGDMGTGVFVDQLSEPAADCVTRLVRLLDTPAAVPILHASIMRELSYWMLTGPTGDKIARLAMPDGHAQRIADAINVMREDIARPVRIEALASVAGMSPSSFHQHFKSLTSMTPLQYQKQLRLIEARRQLVAASANIANIAYRVGYQSPSQFSREYARMFGAPPKRDATALGAGRE